MAHDEIDLESMQYVIDADDDTEEEVIPYPDDLKAALPDLIAKHRRLYVYPTAMGLVVYRKASEIDHRNITASKLADKPTQLVDNQLKCGWNSAVWPSKSIFSAWAEEYPGIPLTVGILAWSKANGDRQATKKKR